MVTYDLGQVVGAKGDKGDAGKGISSISKTSANGLVDTYTITYTDNTTSTFTVTNGDDASITVDSSLSSSSTNPVQNKVVKSALDGKSDTGHNHTKSQITDFPSIPSAFTGTMLADTQNGSVGSSTTWARGNHTHPKSSLYADASHTHNEYLTSHQDVSGKANISDLGSVAFSNSYDDLDDKPNIPNEVVVDTSLSSTSNNAIANSTVKSALDGKSDTGHTHSQYLTSHQSLANYVQKSSTTGLLKNDGTVDANSYLTTGSASSTYQAKLVSGTNIKTVNNESLLGNGNITIQSGSSVDIVTAWESTPSDSKVASEKLVKDTLDTKLGTSIGSASGRILTTTTNGVIQASTSISDSKVSAQHTYQYLDNTVLTQSDFNIDVDVALKNISDSIGTAIQYINQ